MASARSICFMPGDGSDNPTNRVAESVISSTEIRTCNEAPNVTESASKGDSVARFQRGPENPTPGSLGGGAALGHLSGAGRVVVDQPLRGVCACGSVTEWLCADCFMDRDAHVFVCSRSACRDAHEKAYRCNP